MVGCGRICRRARSARRSASCARKCSSCARERDLEGRVGVFRDRARRRPSEVSAFIDEYRERFGVEPICQTLGVSASAYYQRATGERSERSVEDERLTAQIREVHKAELRVLRVPAGVARAAASGRAGRPRPRRAVDAPGGRSGARSGAGSRGGQRSPIPRRRSALIWSTETSPRPRRTGCGSATLPTCGPGRGACTSRS